MFPRLSSALAFGLLGALSLHANSTTAPAPDDGTLCTGFGPQAPRDIRSALGSNGVSFTKAPPSDRMNLCNIHTHTNAEHAGPGFIIDAGRGEHGGFQCNDTALLSEAEIYDPGHGDGPFHDVKPGDTIEVHWVFSTCEVAPGKGLGSCMSESCANPELRVETQVFLVVNDPGAADFRNYDWPGQPSGDRQQPAALPVGTGTPVTYLGSTTGPSYSQATCSPMQVTWSVRPDCARVDITSLREWGERNAFGEEHSHGVRALVTHPALLSPID